MDKYKKKHKSIILKSGGQVEDDLFVTKVGVLMTKKSRVTKEAIDLFEDLNIDQDTLECEQHAEFNSRITYLSFKDKKTSSKEYNNMMINELGHRSVYNDEHVTFLISGCSLETMLEFVAHNEATVARLTSSKTFSQNDTLYRIQTKGLSEEFIQYQKDTVLKFVSMFRKEDNKLNELENEINNILNLGNKAVSFTITMSIKDWYKTIIGRLSHHGVENEMIEIVEEILSILQKEYPFFFKSKEEYYAMNNNNKYLGV